MQSLAARISGPFYFDENDERVRLFWASLPTDHAAPLQAQASFLSSLVAGSPYLASLIQHDPAFAADMLDHDPDEELNALLADVAKVGLTMDLPEVHVALRKLKAKAALLIALCDLGAVWTLDQVTGALSRFADAAVSAAVNALLRDAAERGKITLSDPARPSLSSGYVVLGMGKHGANELNYSSDIDLIVLYDPETAHLADGVEAGTFFVRLTRAMVSLLQDVDEHGYVFRVDLRLRPDPRATQVAVALESAAIYYENMGQNWERAAYIKARPVAGDIALGEEFLARLVPYVWRKYLDFASIADVQSLIRQIHAVKGHGEIAVEGHNLKLGRGGIREIEFFVQTQQLIAGGRNKALRGKRTVDMLNALAEAGWISRVSANEMAIAYETLRRLEHRSQMQNDQQTHAVPQTVAAFDVYARFAGFASGDELRAAIRSTLECVTNHSSRLFAESGSLGGDEGALVFTGGEDDPATLDTLHAMGFSQASDISATIRGWHFGRYGATRDRRAREALTELMPKLLKALAGAGDADRAFFDFDRFLQGLPAGVQLFAMLKSNPGLLDLLARILGTAPRLADGMSRQPRVLEAVLDPSFFGSLPSAQNLAATLHDATPDGLNLDETMDRVRVFKREQAFRVGVRVLSETMGATEAGAGFSNIADVSVGRLLQAVQDDMARQHGQVPGGAVAVIAMGKLGGREMTAASDLDLIVVFDHDPAAESSNGPRPLQPAPYFTRLSQRLVTSLSVPTAEGSLYDVDMRLRPSGSKGPVAVSLGSFTAYQKESAWTWEKLALTRARVIAGDPALRIRLEAAIHAALTTARDPDATRDDVATMRGLMLKEHGPTSVWDIKRARGGLVEIEFIAQFLQLLHAPVRSAVLNQNTAQALARLNGEGCLESADAELLLASNTLYHRLTQLLRLCLDGEFEPQTALPGLKAMLSQIAEVPGIPQVEDLLRETQAKVAAVFDRIVAPPKKS